MYIGHVIPGDSMTSNVFFGSVNLNNMKFSTRDVDNDRGINHYIGGWWYNECFYAKLTGLYGSRFTDYVGSIWRSWLGKGRGPQFMEMKIRTT
jgi:hypothetical protein